jgi:hypothetical protein
MCILALDFVDEIIKKHNISNNGFEIMHVTDEIKYLSLLFYLHFNSQHHINRDFFITGNMTKRLHKNEVCHEKLIVRSNGLQDNKTNVTLEISSSPHGYGAYDGKITIHKYSNFQMNSLSSSFTLYC